MRLITRLELAACNKSELNALYREAFNCLARSEPETPARRNALASLENICRELSLRH